MWVSAATLRRGELGPGAEPVAEFLKSNRVTPTMVVDGRSYDSRGTATATYRLMKELSLVRAYPVACWTVHASAAHDHLAAVVSALKFSEPALVVAATTGAMSRWGAALVTMRPTSTSICRLVRPVNYGLTGNGFLDLIIQVATDEPNVDIRGALQ